MTKNRAIVVLTCLAAISACGQRDAAGPAPKPVAGSQAASAAGASPGAWPALDEQFLQASAATLSFRLGKPQPLAVTSDHTVLFRRTGARERRAELFALSPDGTIAQLTKIDELLRGGDERLSTAERARRERTRTATSGVVDIDVSDDGQRVLFAIGARVFVLERKATTKDGGAHEVGLGSGDAYDPHLSPDGLHVSFVRDGDLWLADVGPAGLPPRRLTQHPDGLEYGVAEFVAQEELDRPRGYFWSPDSRWLAFQRTDARAVSTLYVGDPAHPDQAPTPFKYPRAGTANAIVDLGLVSIDGGAPRWVSWDLERFPYLAHVEWSKHGPLCLTVLNRAQSELALLAVELGSGATRELLRASDSAWLDVPVGAPRWFEDGTGFLWLSERETGYALELHGADGKLLREILPAEQGTRAIVGVEPDGSAAIVLGSHEPREQHVWRVPLTVKAPPVALTADGGYHVALADHGVVVISSALRAGGARAVAIEPDGSRRELPAVNEQPALVPTTKLETIALRERTLYAAVTRPHAFAQGRRYPVLLKVYGGPGTQTVLDVRDTYLMDQWYADAGFVVVRIDGRGTPNRGRSWERAIDRDLITVPLGDQVAGLQALFAQHPELDRARVGVFGWSFGGYMAVMGLLLQPDVFKAAVAGAPVTDWSLYDTAYTERYMKLPSENVAGYKQTSALTHAASLRGALLLMHGVSDDNVYFANTLALLDALYRAGKRAEVIALGSTHMLTDPKLAFARERAQVDFFREKLGRE
jgi:dipeptidyl-peptidase-4